MTGHGRADTLAVSVGHRVIAILCVEPRIAGHEYTPFSFGARRIQATLLTEPALAGAEVRLVESERTDPEYWLAQIERIRPDLIGFSAYIWSFAAFVAVTRRLRAMGSRAAIVFGGPSARPQMFELPPYADAADMVDALVLGEGEWTFAALARLPVLAREGFAAVPGVAVRTRGGWHTAPERESGADMDDLPSPLRMGLVPTGRTVALESFRGCPMSCSFCQWGKMSAPDRVFSQEYLTRELTALRELQVPTVNLVDSGINLNSRAFRNLVAAEREAGYLREHRLFASVYPTELGDEHLAFLGSIRRPGLDVGIQSFNQEALHSVHRPFRESRFARVIEALCGIAEVEVEIILGLPGDSPAAFRRTLERALELPCRVRIFHCLVLPEALMVRATPEQAVRFDPVSLKIESCRGWTPQDLEQAREELAALAASMGGDVEDNMWSCPPSRAPEPRAAWPGPTPELRTGAPALTGELRQALREASDGAWELLALTREAGVLHARIATPDGEFELDMALAQPDGRYFGNVGGVGFSYRRREQADLPATLLQQIRGVAQRVHPTVSRVLAATRLVVVPG